MFVTECKLVGIAYINRFFYNFRLLLNPSRIDTLCSELEYLIFLYNRRSKLFIKNMKTVQVDKINPNILRQENEPIAIEHKGNLLGYFYPVSYQPSSSDMTEKWEKLEEIIEQAAKESDLAPEVLIDILDPSQPFPFESKSMVS